MTFGPSPTSSYTIEKRSSAARRARRRRCLPVTAIRSCAVVLGRTVGKTVDWPWQISRSGAAALPIEDTPHVRRVHSELLTKRGREVTMTREAQLEREPTQVRLVT